jgi:hypothetical protein
MATKQKFFVRLNEQYSRRFYERFGAAANSGYLGSTGGGMTFVVEDESGESAINRLTCGGLETPMPMTQAFHSGDFHAAAEQASRTLEGWSYSLYSWGDAQRPQSGVAELRLAKNEEIATADTFNKKTAKDIEAFQRQVQTSELKIWRVELDDDGADGLGLMQDNDETIHQTRASFDAPDGNRNSLAFLVLAGSAEEAQEKVIDFIARQTFTVNPAEADSVEEFRQQTAKCRESSEFVKKLNETYRPTAK